MKTLLKLSIMIIAFNISLWTVWTFNWLTRPAKEKRVIIVNCSVQ